MKIETRVTADKKFCHLWLIPSIEVDFEHFKSRDFGEYKWLHITLSWLCFSLDIEFINAQIWKKKER